MCKICRAIVKSLPSEKLLVDYVNFFKRIHQDNLTRSQVMSCAKQALYTVDEIFKRNLQDQLERVLLELEETFHEEEQNSPPSDQHPPVEDREPLSHDEEEVRDAGGPSDSTGTDAPVVSESPGTFVIVGSNGTIIGGGGSNLNGLSDFFELLSKLEQTLTSDKLASDPAPESSN